MSSFRCMSIWPAGYLKAISRWLLNNRRDVAARLKVIEAEVARIGIVRMQYQTEVRPDGSSFVTENRIGFTVTAKSSLERLVRAYIANGGNPLNISMFLRPNTTEMLDAGDDATPATFFQTQPHGGVLAPKSADVLAQAQEPGATGYEADQGGWVESDQYYPARMGRRSDRGGWDDESMVKSMHQIRAWANLDIKERLQDIEWRIIKLSDLREQLTHEAGDMLQQALGGTVKELGEFNPALFVSGLRVDPIIQALNEMVFNTSEDGTVTNWGVNNVVREEILHVLPDVPSGGYDNMNG